MLNCHYVNRELRNRFRFFAAFMHERASCNSEILEDFYLWAAQWDVRCGVCQMLQVLGQCTDKHRMTSGAEGLLILQWSLGAPVVVNVLLAGYPTFNLNDKKP